jgi:hypothetical protein
MAKEYIKGGMSEKEDKKKDMKKLDKHGLSSKADKAKFEKMDKAAHAKSKKPMTRKEDEKKDAKLIDRLKSAKKK